MSFQIPKSFYGAGYAVCAILFFVSYMSNVDDRIRVVGIILASLFFIVVTVVYWWDRDEFYKHVHLM